MVIVFLGFFQQLATKYGLWRYTLLFDYRIVYFFPLLQWRLTFSAVDISSWMSDIKDHFVGKFTKTVFLWLSVENKLTLLIYYWINIASQGAIPTNRIRIVFRIGLNCPCVYCQQYRYNDEISKQVCCLRIRKISLWSGQLAFTLAASIFMESGIRSKYSKTKTRYSVWYSRISSNQHRHWRCMRCYTL